MLLIMGVNLYMSRLVLEILGVEDYGLYNVIGGMVVLFSLLSSSLSSSVTRFSIIRARTEQGRSFGNNFFNILIYLCGIGASYIHIG